MVMCLNHSSSGIPLHSGCALVITMGRDGCREYSDLLLLNHLLGLLILQWVTTRESKLLYVFFVFLLHVVIHFYSLIRVK